MRNVSLTSIILFSCVLLNAQNSGFQQLFEINNGAKPWNALQLNEEVLRSANYNFSDVRIWNFTPSDDTLEAPYFIEEKRSKINEKNLVSKVINKRFENGEYSFVLAVKDGTEIPLTRKIKLDFNDENFHWFARIEGSQDMKSWALISERNELVSVQNEYTNYKFTTLNFEPVRYLFIRIRFAAPEKPSLSDATISYFTKTEPDKSEKKVSTSSQIEEDKTTVIYLTLNGEQLVNQVQLTFNDTIDFYRRVSIEYLSEIVSTEKGDRELYSVLTNGVISSAEPAQFSFGNTLTNKLRITIYNNDDLPLSFNQARVFGSIFQLTYRGIGPGNYAIAFENERLGAPNYDLNKFRNKIPKKLELSSIGERITIADSHEKPASEPSNWWLWLVIVPAIVLMGWFSVKMLKSAKD